MAAGGDEPRPAASRPGGGGGDAFSLEGVAAGGKRAMAAALAAIERRPGDPTVVALLDRAVAAPKAHVVGITGPPGVGKSSLIDALIRRWRAAGRTVGIVAVDPSSRRSGGALLGDRTRMATDPLDPGVYVRSLASRGRLGGLADLAYPVAVLMRAVYDRVIVESVGVGQSEAEITGIADTVLLCVQPGSGDSLQFMKAGIMEIPDIIAVTKADFGAAALRAEAELKAALSLATAGEWPVAVTRLSSQTGEGLDGLDAALADHLAFLAGSGRLDAARRAQAGAWVDEAIREAAGRQGLQAAQALIEREAGRSGPFETARTVLARLTVSTL
ncbi:MAG: methylmalonyl Co-A mutase-associated GTPase MeaB [Hyphomicrobiaceae bacterium]